MPPIWICITCARAGIPVCRMRVSSAAVLCSPPNTRYIVNPAPATTTIVITKPPIVITQNIMSMSTTPAPQRAHKHPRRIPNR